MAIKSLNWFIFLRCIYFGVHGDLFSREHIAVWFDRYVSATDDGPENDEDVILQFISTVSMRFSKVLLSAIHLESDRATKRKVTSVTAQYNKNRNSSQNAIELFFVFNNPGQTNRQQLNLTLKAAQQSNLIYPGTVSTIMLNMIDWDAKYIEGFKQDLDFVTKAFPQYKLWGQLPTFAICTSNEQKVSLNVLPVLTYFEKVVVNPVLFEPRSGELTIPSNSEVTQILDKCVTTFSKFSINLAFQTNWRDPYSFANKNVTNMVTFWRWVNAWAVKTNTVVIMREAFDAPYPNDRISKDKGWWKWRRVAGEYKFKEKATADDLERDITSSASTPSPPPQQAPPTQEKQKPSKDSWWVYVTGVVGVVLIIAVTLSIVVFHQKYKKQAKALQKATITLEEIRHFFGGDGEPVHDNLTPTTAINAVYNKDLEVAKDCFVLDKNSSLGAGAFGSVYKCSISKTGESSDVAAKMTKPFSPATAVTSILMEIKILSFLGQHPNIVFILGAHTEDVEEGKVYLFLELCPVGSLEKYLRQHRSEYMDAPCERYINYPVFCQSDLQQWTLDVVHGMEFLASKHVVHADLATRNILLDSNKKAKICDFGLSRRLYDYTCYKKSKAEPLPWRWMPPESLMYLEFNEKTDVWAFGVTIWEIYSFGEIPYAGLSWSSDFASNKLTQQGLRPEKPQSATDRMYSVMSSCWNINQASRPTFSELRMYLDALT